MFFHFVLQELQLFIYVLCTTAHYPTPMLFVGRSLAHSNALLLLFVLRVIAYILFIVLCILLAKGLILQNAALSLLRLL